MQAAFGVVCVLAVVSMLRLAQLVELGAFYGAHPLPAGNGAPMGATTTWLQRVHARRDAQPPTVDTVVRMLVMIACPSTSAYIRMAHRQMWAGDVGAAPLYNDEYGVAYLIDVLFFVGTPLEPEARARVAPLVDEERAMFGDVVVDDGYFEFSRVNLSRMMFRAFERVVHDRATFPRAYDYYVRMDSDVFPVWRRIVALPHFVPHRPRTDNVVFGRYLWNGFVREILSRGVPLPLSEQLRALIENTAPAPESPDQCFCGEMYGLSANLVAAVVDSDAVRRSMVPRQESEPADDVFVCAWLSQVVTDWSSLDRRLLYIESYRGAWVHSDALKDPKVFSQCFSARGCVGEMFNHMYA